MVGFADGGRRLEPRNEGRLEKQEKVRNHSSLDFLKEHSPADSFLSAE